MLFVRTVGVWAFRLLACTWRLERTGWDAFLRRASTEGALGALWHGHLAMGLWPHRGRGYCGLVSPHQDGDVLCELLERFGYRALRGSTHERSVPAVREAWRALGGPTVLVLTPDGPRGPRHRVQRGAAWLARSTGVPLVPVRFEVDRAWQFRSWDSHLLPKPFARVRIDYGEPIPLVGDDHAVSAALERRLLEPLGPRTS